MLRYTTDRARPGLVAFLHPARKWSGYSYNLGTRTGQVILGNLKQSWHDNPKSPHKRLCTKKCNVGLVLFVCLTAG